MVTRTGSPPQTAPERGARPPRLTGATSSCSGSGPSGQQPEICLGSPRAALPWRSSWGLTWSRNGWGWACVTITALRKDRTEENRPCSPGRSRVRRRQLSHRNRPTITPPLVPSCPHRLSWVKGRRESLCPHLRGSEIPLPHRPRGLQVHLTPLSPQHHPPGERSGPHTPQTHLRSSQWLKLERCGQQKKKVILDENPGYKTTICESRLI